MDKVNKTLFTNVLKWKNIMNPYHVPKIYILRAWIHKNKTKISTFTELLRDENDVSTNQHDAVTRGIGSVGKGPLTLMRRFKLRDFNIFLWSIARQQRLISKGEALFEFVILKNAPFIHFFFVFKSFIHFLKHFHSSVIARYCRVSKRDNVPVTPAAMLAARCRKSWS